MTTPEEIYTIVGSIVTSSLATWGVIKAGSRNASATEYNTQTQAVATLGVAQMQHQQTEITRMSSEIVTLRSQLDAVNKESTEKLLASNKENTALQMQISDLKSDMKAFRRLMLAIINDPATKLSESTRALIDNESVTTIITTVNSGPGGVSSTTTTTPTQNANA